MIDNLRVLILAAGKSTRMKSKYAKVLHKAGGATLIDHVLRAARSLSTEITIVIGHSAEKIRELLPESRFVEQKEQLGTGHAVMSARDDFKGYAGNVLILPGDVPLVSAKTLEALVEFHVKGGYAASILTTELSNPHGYGRIVRKTNDEVESIVEHRDAHSEVLKIREINSGVYVFDAPSLFEALTKIGTNNAQGEFYLTDAIGILVESSQRVGAFKIDNSEEVLGINTRQELAAVDRVMRRNKCDALMTNGVTIIDPDSTFIDVDVHIGPDTVIYPSVQIQGQTFIGEDVTIHSFCRVANSKIGARSVLLNGCVIVNSTLGEQLSVGPYAHLRTDVTLADRVKVGNFVELKKASLGTGSKSMHLAYLGDATIGENVNIGAGTITCNYDGFQKHPTVIEDGAFIGTDSQLIAPVRIGKNAYIAAGSSITDDVPPDSLAIARGRQAVKEGWVKERKKKKK
jgi:bifunctional UDP-N-acetylglucosamine pyrophosphorylase / glucosamine-1-phosphate N-acetyltransferase